MQIIDRGTAWKAVGVLACLINSCTAFSLCRLALDYAIAKNGSLEMHPRISAYLLENHLVLVGIYLVACLGALAIRKLDPFRYFALVSVAGIMTNLLIITITFALFTKAWVSYGPAA